MELKVKKEKIYIEKKWISHQNPHLAPLMSFSSFSKKNSMFSLH
jgi:hypothetical protein